MWEFKGCVENGVMNKFHSRHQTGEEEEDDVNIFTFYGPTFEVIQPYSYMLLAWGVWSRGLTTFERPKRSFMEQEWPQVNVDRLSE